jgi:uncharacterized BrkB/YihY/UPF0761 family membrane protein
MSETSSPHPDIALPAEQILASAQDVMDRPRRGIWRRVLRPLVLVLTAQYTIVLLISLSVVGTVRALALPQILSSFETITAALKRTAF